MVQQCRNMEYNERLKFLSLPTLAYRRIRGDMIEVFKIINGKYDKQVTPCLKMSKNIRTRGNSRKLETVRAHYDRRKYFFCDRIVCVWNSLPDSIVNTTSVNSFKEKLDSFWSEEQLVYDFEAKLSGIGARGLLAR